MIFSKSTVASLCAAVALLAASTSDVDAYSFTPARSTSPFSVSSSYKYYGPTNKSSYKNKNGNGASSLQMISTGDDRSERKSLDISKTQYVSLIKAPKDAYIAFAEKGASNAK